MLKQEGVVFFKRKQIAMLLILICSIALLCITLTQKKYFCSMRIVNEESIIANKRPVHFDSLTLMVQNCEISCIDDEWFLLPETIGKDWQVSISAAKSDMKVYIIKDDFMSKKSDAIRNNHAFRVIFLCGDYYDIRLLRFTNLPLMNVQTMTGKAIDDGPTLATITLFDTRYQNMSRSALYIQRMQAAMHVRGNMTSGLDKKGYKINTMDDELQSTDVNMLGLFDDNDWVLDALYTDRSKARSKIVTYFASLFMEDREYPHYPYQVGCYVELVVNGEYRGLYDLKTNVDRKYLGINKTQDVAIKIKNNYPVNEEMWTQKIGNEENIGCIYPMYPRDGELDNEEWEVIHKLSSVFFQDDCQMVEEIIPYLDIDNQIDQAILVSLFYMWDNTGTNNVIYIYNKEKEKYYRTMWDFDNSIYVSEDDIWLTKEIQRLIDFVPDLNERLKMRWNEVHNKYLTDDNVDYIVDTIFDELVSSGALYREFQKWPRPFVIESESQIVKIFDKVKGSIQECIKLTEGYFNDY